MPLTAIPTVRRNIHSAVGSVLSGLLRGNLWMYYPELSRRDVIYCMIVYILYSTTYNIVYRMFGKRGSCVCEMELRYTFHSLFYDRCYYIGPSTIHYGISSTLFSFYFAHRNIRISAACNIDSSSNSAPYDVAGFIAVLYTSCFTFVGMFLSHMKLVSLHFDHAVFIVLLASFLALQLTSNNDPVAHSHTVICMCSSYSNI